jgi:soluble lytic murein transglycosylase-like protein
MQTLRCAVFAAVVLVFGSIHLANVDQVVLATVSTAQLFGARGDLPAPPELVAAERLAALAAALAPPILESAPAPPLQTRAQPKPRAPLAVPRPAGDIQNLIWSTFAPLGPNAQSWALRVANCESHFNPSSVNKTSGAMGLFQFMPSTWAGSPYAAQSPFDPVANTQAAFWLYKTYGPGRWSCK